jgi:hypothetical protein
MVKQHHGWRTVKHIGVIIAVTETTRIEFDGVEGIVVDRDAAFKAD